MTPLSSPGSTSDRGGGRPLGGSPDRPLAQGIFETIREPLLVLDEELRVAMANPAFSRVFAVEPEDVVGRRIFELGDGAWDIPELREALEEVLPQDESFEGLEVEHVFPELGHRAMELNARQIHDDEGATRRILLAIDDVTEEREARREVERSNRDLEQFAYVASHDLQEPLRMVSSYVQLLARRYEGELDEDADEFIGYAVDGAERMKSLIDDLLAYSRVGRKGGDPEPVDLGELTAEVEADLQNRLDEAGVELTWGELPVVRGRRSQLRRVLQNLVENALQHGDGTVSRVEVASRPAGPRHEVTVRDDGPGIDPGEGDRIFQVFQQLEASGGRGGSGLGLAICRKIVEDHGGRIRLEEAEGSGAAFSFTLPRAAPPRPESHGE